MIKKEIEINGVPVPFRASATVPRLYRGKFKRDIFRDLIKLEKTIKDNEEDSSGVGVGDLEMFENVAYIMAKHADPSQPDTPEEWLDQFDVFSIYAVLPQILELWNLNMFTDSIAKKKQGQAAGK